MSDLSTWLRWTAGELKTGPIEDGVLEAGMIQCADEIERLQSQLVSVRKALKDLVDESFNPGDGGEFEDGEWPALDRARITLSDEKNT